MNKKKISRTLLSIMSLIANSIFLINDFFNIIFTQCFMIVVSAILVLIFGASGQDFSSVIGFSIIAQLIFLIIGIFFVILYICSLIAPFINKVVSKKTIIFSIMKTCLMIVLYVIYYIIFMKEKHGYIFIIIFINFIEMCYNLILLLKNEKERKITVL